MSIASVLAPYIFSGGDISRDGSCVWTSTAVPNNSEDHPYDRSPNSGDVALAQRIQAGDEDAMRILVLEYADRLTRFAFTIVQGIYR